MNVWGAHAQRAVVSSGRPATPGRLAKPARPGRTPKPKAVAALPLQGLLPGSRDQHTAAWLEKARHREFQLWENRANLGQVLLRSPLNPENPANTTTDTNLDLILLGAAYLEIPTRLRGIAFDQPTTKEAARLRRAIGSTDKPVEVLILVSQGNRYAVAADVFLVDENAMDVNESPFGPRWARDPSSPMWSEVRELPGPFVTASPTGRRRA